MITRCINLLLLLLAAVGFLYTFRARSELRKVRGEHDLLAAQFGTLDVEDPEKYYVVRIDTGDPMHFAWRIYRPDKLQLKTRASSIGGGSNSWSLSGPAGEEIFRIRFRIDERGMRVFSKRQGSSSTFGLGDPQTDGFLKKHWEELDIEVMGDGEAEEAATDQVLKLLSIRVPESLAAQANQEIGRQVFQMPPQPIMIFRMGTREAFQEADKKQSP